MKRTSIATTAALLLLSVAACSQPYGPGRGASAADAPVEGYRTGPGGYGMGPGMMGGSGPGPAGGMGPGMMGGSGPGPAGGMGPGMMGREGPGPAYGMGPGMMGRPGLSGLDLSEEQLNRIAEANRDLVPQQRALMERMQELLSRSDPYAAGTFDEEAARKTYDGIADLRKQMFELWLQSQKRTDAVLTAQQREQLRQGWRSR